MNLTMFAVIAAATALTAHLLIRSFFAAVLLSALAASVAYQLYVRFHMTYADPFFFVGGLVGASTDAEYQRSWVSLSDSSGRAHLRSTR